MLIAHFKNSKYKLRNSVKTDLFCDLSESIKSYTQLLMTANKSNFLLLLHNHGMESDKKKKKFKSITLNGSFLKFTCSFQAVVFEHS